MTANESTYKKDFENALEMIEWQNTMLRQQQAEIKRLIGSEPITYGMLTVCKNCGQQNPYFERAQEK
jgi:hypothetical protein